MIQTQAAPEDKQSSGTPAAKRTLRSIEIRFKPNARILDQRGFIAERLAEAMGFPDWRVNRNTAMTYNDNKSIEVAVSYGNAVLRVIDGTRPAFDARLNHVIHFLTTLPNCENGVETLRVGARSMVAIPFDGSFEELRDKILSTYASPHETAQSRLRIGDRYRFDDLAFTFHLTGTEENVHLSVGPMREEEFHAPFTWKEGFPDVGLFVDADAFTTPDSTLHSSRLRKEIERLLGCVRVTPFSSQQPGSQDVVVGNRKNTKKARQEKKRRRQARKQGSHTSAKGKATPGPPAPHVKSPSQTAPSGEVDEDAGHIPVIGNAGMSSGTAVNPLGDLIGHVLSNSISSAWQTQANMMSAQNHTRVDVDDQQDADDDAEASMSSARLIQNIGKGKVVTARFVKQFFLLLALLAPLAMYGLDYYNGTLNSPYERLEFYAAPSAFCLLCALGAYLCERN